MDRLILVICPIMCGQGMEPHSTDMVSEGHSGTMFKDKKGLVDVPEGIYGSTLLDWCSQAPES